MLTKSDIELIKETRAEITQNRTDPIDLIHRIEGAEDPFTGEATTEDMPERIESTWRRWTSQSPGSNDIEYVNGVRIESGDVMADFPIGPYMDDVRRVYHVDSDEWYDIQARDIIGLGEPNRNYLLLRRVV